MSDVDEDDNDFPDNGPNIDNGNMTAYIRNAIKRNNKSVAETENWYCTVPIQKYSGEEEKS